MALEVLGSSPAPRTDLSYGPAELFLRRRVHGTAFQPDAFRSFPGLITARDLVEDIFLQLDCQNFSLASKVVKTILPTALYQLQLYWADTQLRGLPGFSQGPQWRSQMRRSSLQHDSTRAILRRTQPADHPDQAAPAAANWSPTRDFSVSRSPFVDPSGPPLWLFRSLCVLVVPCTACLLGRPFPSRGAPSSPYGCDPHHLLQSRFQLVNRRLRSVT